MLQGYFKNCYGLENFSMMTIPFNPKDNKAIIYAPNGVMKSSFAKVFDNLARKKSTEDRIFSDRKSSFSIQYYDETFSNLQKKAVPNIYVINSFDDQFESYSDSVATILADANLKEEYDKVFQRYSDQINTLLSAFQAHTSMSPAQIQNELCQIFNLPLDSDWDVIVDRLSKCAADNSSPDFLTLIKYETVFNPQTMKVLTSPSFYDKVQRYILILDELINQSTLLNSQFDDYNATEFGKSVEKTQIFAAKHKIVLKNGYSIESIEEWNTLMRSEMKRINDTPELSAIHKEIGKILNGNIATRELKNVIQSNRGIIRYLSNIEQLQCLFWLSYIESSDINIQTINSSISLHKKDMDKVTGKANDQLQNWQNAIDVFRRRFRAPFIVDIENPSKVVLKGEPARLTFKYERGSELREKTKDELMACLSVGEKRALYLLQILFDLEKIRANTVRTGKKHLVIADDIADSFDYSNKYAIIEYLSELVENMSVDVLVLTHNFDFYRTISSRLSIGYNMCFVVQKDVNQNITMEKFQYRSDFFEKGILEKIRDGKIKNDHNKLKLLIASIPFCRNISSYIADEILEDSLTSLVHIKPDTLEITVDMLWSVLKESAFSLGPLECPNCKDIPVVQLVFNLANDLCKSKDNSVSLENKIVLSIAIRLKTEIFLKILMIRNNIELECSSNQTRTWISRVKDIITPEQQSVLDSVSLITPESIHVNAFMYEPLIDIPNWKLFDLYEQCCQLESQKPN